MQQVNGRIADLKRRFRDLVAVDDLPGCHQLAEAEALFWPQTQILGDSLGEVVAKLAVQANSLRVLQHQLQLPVGAAEAAAARCLPCGGRRDLPAASTHADALVVPRDADALGRLLARCAGSELQEPAALMLLAAGAPATWSLVMHAVRQRMPALLAALLRTLPASEVPPLPAPDVLRVPCPAYRQPPYNDSPALLLLGGHAERGRDPMDPTSLSLGEALAAAGLQPPVFRDVRVVREVRLPRLLPRKLRMNLRLGHTQQAVPQAVFSPGLEDPCFGTRDRCRYVWLALTHQPWSPAHHGAWPAAFREATRALLLAAHRQTPQAAVAAGNTSGTSAAAAAAVVADSSTEGANGREQGAVGQQGADPLACEAATLGSLPAGVLMHIIGLAVYPLSSWAGNAL